MMDSCLGSGHVYSLLLKSLIPSHANRRPNLIINYINSGY